MTPEVSTTPPSSTQQLTREQARAEAWRRGLLSWKLYPCQKAVYLAIVAFLDNPTALRFVLEIARRFGKSFIVALVMCELAIRNPGWIMHYAAPTAKQVRNIFIANLRVILADCPAELRPQIKVSEGIVEFPNGSVIHMAGCEDELKADRLRGPSSNLFVVDEAGFIPVLEYVVKSVATPMLLTTDGHMLAISSPARSIGHYFTRMCIQAEAEGNYAHRTIYDSTVNGTPERVARFMEGAGGEHSSEWQREFLAKRVSDLTRAVVPEFPRVRQLAVCEFEVPAYYDTYTTLDPGQHPSLCAILFAFYDFKRAVLCIQDETTGHNLRTDQIAEAVRVKERELWADDMARWVKERPFVDGLGEVFVRTSDVDLLLLNDMANLHGMHFSPAIKDNKEAAINDLRVALTAGRIEIHPRCKQLIAHLEAAIWNKRRTQYEFVDGFGHFDLLDCLIYKHRAVDRVHNPWPSEAFQHGYADDYFTRPGAETPELDALDALREAFA